MPTLIEVIKDLWRFICGELFISKETEAHFHTLELPTITARPATKVTKAIAPVLVEPKAENISGYGEKAYVITETTNVFGRPVWMYDGVLFKLAYSASLSVLGYEGRFARVESLDKFGFVLKDEITTNKNDIFPDFQNGEIYSSNHPDTKKLRKLIQDEFFASEMFLPLLAVEFITYRLKQEGRVISWSDTRPRLAGTWQNLLKGRLGIQIGVLPRAGAIIEFNKPDGNGFLGYTKSVHVDESIVIEGVGRLIEGEYREEAFSKEEWHEWRPVFITVS
jgi:hypothetical protein